MQWIILLQGQVMGSCECGNEPVRFYKVQVTSSLAAELFTFSRRAVLHGVNWLIGA